MPIRRAVSAPNETPPVPRSNGNLKSLFVFTPTPKMVRDGRVVVNLVAVDQFWLLLRSRFGDAPIPLYRICEVLNIHRCVLSEWLSALEGRKGVLRKSSAGISVAATNAKLGLVNLKPASRYDPWVDREYDDLMYSYFFAFPWYVIDKYYLITVDEVKHYTGQQRIRPDGRPFTALAESSFDPEEDDFREFRNSWVWRRGEWPKDRYDRLVEAASRPNIEPRRGGINRRISAETSKARARAEATEIAAKVAAEERIDRCGVRGHIWLEDFCRRTSPLTPDAWFIKALAEEVARKEAEERWQTICKKLGYNPSTGSAFTNAAGVGAGKSRQGAGNSRLLRGPPKPKVG